MAKISSEENGLYREKTQSFREAIKKSLKEEEAILLAIRKEPSTASVRRLALAEEMLDFRVRNGNGYNSSTIITRQLILIKGERKKIFCNDKEQ
ncbi:hypothetical protein FACS1894200_12250 [Spirochaetia bacterium]|nr:hypothetical protein FACS1894200_12250 [Spirochaetia bacterium]